MEILWKYSFLLRKITIKTIEMKEIGLRMEIFVNGEMILAKKYISSIGKLEMKFLIKFESRENMTCQFYCVFLLIEADFENNVLRMDIERR